MLCHIMNIITNQYLLFNTDETHIQFVNTQNMLVYCKFDINCTHNMVSLEKIVWKYDANNLRIPYIDECLIPYITLTSADNVYDYISSASLIADSDIICGEKIQYLADIVLGSQSSLNYNPNNKFSKHMQTITNTPNLDNYNSIFIFTHDLPEFYSKFRQLKDKIIISHNSDGEIAYIKDVKMHLAQNCLIRNANLISIPIGIENKQWFDHNIFNKVRQLNIKKTKNIYFYFSLSTHPTRGICYNKLKNVLEWNNSKSKEDYFKELAMHKYAICPRGNGIDTHRLWECLYLNTIPIVIKSDYINIDNLPIIVLDNWDDIKTLTEFENQQFKKLTIRHYDNLLKNAN